MRNTLTKALQLDPFEILMSVALASIPSYLLWVLYGDLGIAGLARNGLTATTAALMFALCVLNVTQLKGLKVQNNDSE